MVLIETFFKFLLLLFSFQLLSFINLLNNLVSRVKFTNYLLLFENISFLKPKVIFDFRY